MSRPSRSNPPPLPPHQPYSTVPQSPTYTPPLAHGYPSSSRIPFSPTDPNYPQSGQPMPPTRDSRDRRDSQSVASGSIHMSPLGPSRDFLPATSTVGRGGEYARADRGEARESTTHGVLTGAIGGGFGPYAYGQSAPYPSNQPPLPPLPPGARDSYRDSIYTLPSAPYGGSYYARQSFAPSESGLSVLSSDKPLPVPGQGAGMATTVAPTPMYLWDAKDPDLDDALHNPDPELDARLDRKWTIASARGWFNMSALLLLTLALLTLFVGYPMIYFFDQPKIVHSGFNLGGINATGQIPDIPGVWQMIDPKTPANAMTRTGYDGQGYDLVFSDEFEVDGRTFYPGDDPYWEAVNLNYWATVDYEWYDPSAITTQDGKLVITMTEELIHNLNWKSGMLQSWNKFCFTTGYIEVSVSLPGSGDVPGFWPGVWMMGNLGRAGYGASTEGVWPYTYDACDLGTFINQTTADGQPAITKTDGDIYNNNQVSYQPGQKLSACTCPGSEHPGPSVSVGRGAPEIDILEAQVNVWENEGSVSQSYQVAPFNDFYEFDNTTTTLYNPAPQTIYNGYKGGVYQQSVSAVTLVSNEDYNNTGYGTFGVEFWSNPSNRGEGFVTWVADGQKTWHMPAAAIKADPITEISDRLVSEEPMSMVLNFGMSPGFQGQDFTRLQFPAKFYIDYVRVYQRTSVSGNPDYQSCDPSTYPTAAYINSHLNAYQNPNLTTWDAAGYSFPRNSLYDGC